MARIPQPPVSSSLTELKQSVTDLISFIRETWENGSQSVGYTQAQIDSFTDQKFLGTIVFNTDTNESNVSFLNGDVVNWRAF